MKKLFCVSVGVLIAGLSFAQRTLEITPPSPIPVDSATFTPLFQEVIQTGSAPVSDIVARARTWVAKTYPSAKDVIQQYDPAQGILVVKAMTTVEYIEHQPSFNVKTKELSNIYHTITVEAKQGRSRITIDGIQYKDQDEIVPGRENAPAIYVARVQPNAVELEAKRKQLDNMAMIGPRMAQKLAPIYLMSDRNKDAALYTTINSILTDIKAAIVTKDKDW